MADVLALRRADFERFCAHLLEELGYERVRIVEDAERRRTGGGVHITCQRHAKPVAVLCVKRRLRSMRSVGVRAVRELGGCMLRDGATHGVILSVLPFAAPARTEAKAMGIETWDTTDISRLLHVMNPSFSRSERGRLMGLVRRITRS